MPCYYPVECYDLDNEPNYRPCGKCIGCRLDYARSWSIRCYHEAQLHNYNCFITLTYNNENLPKNGSVDKKELQKFIKRLRKKIEPKEIRYYACGEYGSKLSRPHYHMCIFGHDFNNKKLLESATLSTWNKKHHNFKNSFDLFTCETLNKLWKKGYHSIGQMSMETAGYVARYCTKKINGQEAPNHYKNKEPEFSLISRMPGIGRKWIEKYLTDVYPKDFLTINGTKYQPPKYYDNYLKSIKPNLYKQIKIKRKENTEQVGKIRKRLYEKDKHKTLITKQLNRRIEND